MDYPLDTLTDDERRRIAPHFTNLDRPVFALVNLPETVKGALFARYSRYQGTLRRLFIDEFAEGLPDSAAAWEGDEGVRAAQLYERIFVGYGDDSVAQLGGAHIACEWTSNVLTKILQRPRLGAYLEQSTRYIAYDKPMPGGGYRYYRDDAFGPRYAGAMDDLFETYARSLQRATEWAAQAFPPGEGESPAAHARAVKAKALDLVRGILPAASLSHMGIFATGQMYEQLILHLKAHPLPEARAYGQMILETVQAVMPSFVARVERPDRGGRWVDYLEEREDAARRVGARLGLDRPDPAEEASVRLVRVEGTEDQLLAATLFEACNASEDTIQKAVDGLPADERAKMLAELVGERENRRHRPGRGFEAVRYRFEIVSDYGAFRDLQRHRMLTVQWQPFTPYLGADTPAEFGAAEIAEDYGRALEASRSEYERLRDEGHGLAAAYALCLGYRIRYVLDLNAREAMHLIELRSGREGHPSYRAVAHEMHRQIAEVHPLVAAAMTHVDTETEPRLERMLSEMRIEAKRRESEN